MTGKSDRAPDEGGRSPDDKRAHRSFGDLLQPQAETQRDGFCGCGFVFLDLAVLF